MTVEAFAPAKINLTLHVTGQREDGYHLLDSLVVFADIGDRLTLDPAEDISLSVTGPRAEGVPVDGRNLVLKAAALFGAGQGARVRLDKRLPAAAGIGGGSSDAAAALRGLAALWGCDLPGAEAVLSLGADVPVCLAPGPVRMRGVGEEILPAPALPEFGILLVNPGVEVPTPAVFRGLARKTNAPMPDLPGWGSAAGLADWLAGQRNDLEPPARAEAPVIGEVLAAIAATPGCLLARMSGSGATCFGIYADRAAAERAAVLLHETRPDWWAEAGAPYRL
ncbi:4-(cytidine 5'-diphospho)-2-C-methyl-D-erythritol kinase [Rhodovulum sulfidophilum]|uniref:4-(cytidine 5'-diphospho)-2-C-methyl-D-erythritol kinase n=1 Tax=Rhodovulum sulfidophilum TaxID=35806 RepID=UPI001921FAEB|nr:4-(cytidine 5'-diphospho)-2-C-methyl-D-erythritol kinase [Rhodovulum sulfidophilum]MBL3573466.1 4-(cytidine 5'-diphospho)-2-C-methyl-D-erythritol kinase [Rhodovulum sulfidophilum]MCE8432003.1 4-(cytidine 5'-diphospho)-2-C-methyl-D-erythritol kinase [Rhodovulum sulfidophilum]MCF4117373.1 4-(cytidine 5'-diphospho)-2-C-methyl-D-erythritol kinase [Rhodovulum sulfidophilum]